MFTAKDVTAGNDSKYQTVGVSEKVKVTEVILNHNEQYNSYSLTIKTINENDQVGQSKRMSLNTEVREGNKVAAFTVTAKNLINILMSTGKTLEESQAVLEAKDQQELAKKVSSALVGKEFRGLFGKREYNPGKFVTELYTTEPVGGTKLVWDADNPYYVKRMPGSASNTASPDGHVSTTSDLPF